MTTPNPPATESSRCASCGGKCCCCGWPVLLGRILFSVIFVLSGFHHFNPAVIQYAAGKIPAPGFLVPASGVLAILGGLSIILGYRARFGALLIVIFLVPVTLTMHAFWSAPDAMRQMQMAMFMKNVSMLGGALFILGMGAGPLSLDACRKACKKSAE